MKNIAVIPARSGSKGLKDKNIKILKGKPLIAYTIEAAKESSMFDEIMVSTDSENYANIALEYGAEVPFLRSEDLSSDIASSWDVVRDILGKYKEKGIEFDTVALLQPTSPLRTSEDVIEGYKIMKEKNANTIVAVCEVDHSPLWTNILPEDNSLHNFINNDILRMPRQNLSTYYRVNGALYIRNVEDVLSTDNIYDEKSFALVMSKNKSIDIDNHIDFEIAELIMGKL